MKKNEDNEKERKPKEKSLIGSLVRGGVLFFSLITGLSSVYTVNQTEQAVITQFGKPVRIILNPIENEDRKKIVQELKERYKKEGIDVDEGVGLKFKIPYIQNVEKFDRRLLRWNSFPEEIPTKDKKYIWVDGTARWYIEDPLKFFKTMGTEEKAQARLDDIIDSVTRNSITKRDLIEIVRTDNRDMQIAEEELRETLDVGYVKEGRPKIVKEITEVSKEACKEYGINIHSEGVLIKGLTYVESVKERVEDRMIAERERIAERYLSEGQGQYEEIMGKKEREIKEIMSTAYKTSKDIEGKADAMAVDIYANGYREKREDPITGQVYEASSIGYNEDRGFYRFLKTLEIYRESLAGEKTKLIIGIDNPLFEILKGKGTNYNSTKK